MRYSFEHHCLPKRFIFNLKIWKKSAGVQKFVFLEPKMQKISQRSEIVNFVRAGASSPGLFKSHPRGFKEPWSRCAIRCEQNFFDPTVTSAYLISFQQQNQLWVCINRIYFSSNASMSLCKKSRTHRTNDRHKLLKSQGDKRINVGRHYERNIFK